MVEKDSTIDNDHGGHEDMRLGCSMRPVSCCNTESTLVNTFHGPTHLISGLYIFGGLRVHGSEHAQQRCKFQWPCW